MGRYFMDYLEEAETRKFLVVNNLAIEVRSFEALLTALRLERSHKFFLISDIFFLLQR